MGAGKKSLRPRDAPFLMPGNLLPGSVAECFELALAAEGGGGDSLEERLLLRRVGSRNLERLDQRLDNGGAPGRAHASGHEGKAKGHEHKGPLLVLGVAELYQQKNQPRHGERALFEALLVGGGVGLQRLCQKEQQPGMVFFFDALLKLDAERLLNRFDLFVFVSHGSILSAVSGKDAAAFGAFHLDRK